MSDTHAKERGLNHSQHLDIFHPRSARSVILIGAGGVGSKVAEQLAKYGVGDLTVYDDDTVDSHNLPSSAYGLEELGLRKVEALRRRLLRDSDLEIRAIARRWQDDPLSEAVIMCVDDMDERRKIWQACRNDPLVETLVDTRVGVELVRVFAVDPQDAEDAAMYEANTRYGREEAMKTTCGNHGVPDVNGLAASAAVALLRGRWMSGRIAKRRFEFKLDEFREIQP